MSAAQAKPVVVAQTEHPAIEYLLATFRAGDRIFFHRIHAWKTHTNRTGEVARDVKTEPLMPLSVACEPATIRKLLKNEADGWNIYVCMNPFPEGSERRLEGLVRTVRNVYIETDEGDARAAIALAVEDGEIPQPHTVLQSSPGKYHVVWHVDGIAPLEAKALNRALASRFGGDPASTDLHRVLRLPGFSNLKYEGKPRCILVDEVYGEPPYTREQFKLKTASLTAHDAPISEAALENIISRFEANAKEASAELGPRRKDLNGYRWDITCPWADAHTTPGKSAILMVLTDGRPEFNCLHNHCANRGWSDIRQLWESAVGHKQKFADPKDLQSFILSREGEIKPLVANAIAMLKTTPSWEGVLGYNLLSMLPVKLRPAPWDQRAGTPWTDHDDTKLVEYFQRNRLYINSSKQAGEVANAVARENSFHPVRNYLDSLKWDGAPRLKGWLSSYLGADDDALTQAVGRCWTISAVARIYQPGCKVDHVLMLEGGQGEYKSTSLNVLAGDEFFLDDFADFDSKDDKLKLHSAWIVEMAELSPLRRDINRVKAFLTCRNDVYRAPYDKRPQHHLRTNVFAATTNDSTPFEDESGARRFWPVKCGRIDIDRLRADRDQLWAEAVALYRKGEKWWLEDKALIALAAGEQRKRYRAGQWDDLIESWLENPVQKFEIFTDEDGKNPRRKYLEPWNSDKDEVTVDDILLHAVGKRQENWGQADKNSVAKCLKHNRWERDVVRMGGKTTRIYRRPVTVSDRNDAGDRNGQAFDS